MKLRLQKKLASKVLKGSSKRVKFEPEVLDEIKEGLTKDDIRGMISRGLITLKNKKGVSRVRANKRAKQRSKGLQKGPGKRKGTDNARNPHKKLWINKVRVQRRFLKELYDKKLITPKVYRSLYNKSKGGFFRSKRHIKLYVEDNDLAVKAKK
jgi:large subunit ribosomal protein L19e